RRCDGDQAPAPDAGRWQAAVADRIPDPLGLPGGRRPQRSARQLPDPVGDGSQHLDAGIQELPGEARESLRRATMSIPGLEIRRSSASVLGGPSQIREVPAVSKYIDTTTCIGCKACEVACQEWND